MKLPFILCCIFLELASSFILVDESEQFLKGQFSHQDDIRVKAFTVLQEKCNICHSTKKKADIFTLVNMDSLAPDIHKQVFVKRKMPKGRKVKLTEAETQHLKVWLAAVLDKKKKAP